jgi:dihydroneopterin aldolase
MEGTKMYVYYIQNRQTMAVELIFGYNFKDACKRSKITDLQNWEIIGQDYED